MDAYPMPGAHGTQLSALLRPCSACRGSWSSPMQHLAALAAPGAEGMAGRACAAGSSWASGVAGAVPQGRLWLEEETTLHRVDVSCSAPPALPYLPHGGREGRCNGHFGGSEGGWFLTRVCKMAWTYSDDSDQFGHGGHDAGVLHSTFGVVRPQSRREKSNFA